MDNYVRVIVERYDLVRYQGSLFYVDIQHNSFKRFNQDEFKAIISKSND